MVLPALVMGKKKHSLDRKQLLNYHGEAIADICQMPGISIIKTMNDQRNSYINLPVNKLISIIKRAGEILVSEVVDGESFQEYVDKFTYSTGLPSGTAKSGLSDLGNSMRAIDKILESEVPEHCIHCLDSGIISSQGGKLAVSPLGKILGVIAPSNHPSVHISWITALAMKYSIIVKPGKDDPFTPNRVINSLLQAGLNDVLISMLPTDQTNIAKIVDGCDRVIFYGNQQAIDLFHSEKIISRGSGNSKVLVDIENMEPDENILDISMQSVMHDGGRRCTNASSIVVIGDAEKFAYRLAEKMSYELTDPINEQSAVGCFKNVETAYELDKYINQNLDGDKDVSGEVLKKPRLQQVEGLTFLNPTVILCRSEASHLYSKELPFPFVTITKAGNDIKKQLSNSLAVALLTKKEDIIRNCIDDPSIGKVILDKPTFSAKIGDPHDGFLFNRLYRIKSYLGSELC